MYMRSRRSFLSVSGATALSAFLSSCATPRSTPAPGPSPNPAPNPAPMPKPLPAPQAFGPFPAIIDASARIDAGKARALKARGVKTVFRYYCHLPPSLPEKDLQPEEARIILSEGLSLGVVFQHYNNCHRTFENRWGREDAEQALRMAAALKQPAGSAIYFGVDGDWPWASMLESVVAYFEDVNRAFEGSGYKVGVYSSGCTCNVIREKGLASYFWLSGSTAYSGTQAFYNTGLWTMYQNALDITLADAKLGVDTNLLNPAANGVFGQFDATAAASAAHPAGLAASLIAGRRFLKASTQIQAAPEPAASVLAPLRKDQNVLSAEGFGAYTRIRTQEGGANASGAAKEGWVLASLLAPMDRFPTANATYGLCNTKAPAPDSARTASCERAVSRER
jgi:hypothetical protein